MVRYGNYCTVFPKQGPILLVPARAFSQHEEFVGFTKISVIEHYCHEEHEFGPKKKRKKKEAMVTPPPPIKFDPKKERPVMVHGEPTGIYDN